MNLQGQGGEAVTPWRRCWWPGGDGGPDERRAAGVAPRGPAREGSRARVPRRAIHPRGRSVPGQEPNAFPPSVDVLVQGKYLRKKYQDPITNNEFDLIGAGTRRPPGRRSPAGTPGRGATPTGATRSGRGHSAAQLARFTRLQLAAARPRSAAASWACTARARRTRSVSIRARPTTTSGTSSSP